MSNLIQIKVAELNQLDPLMIAEDNRVEQKFIQMYNAIWGYRPRSANLREREIQLPEDLTRQAGTAKMHTVIPLWMLFGYSGQRPVT